LAAAAQRKKNPGISTACRFNSHIRAICASLTEKCEQMMTRTRFDLRH
jgi:hypothetical protein